MKEEASKKSPLGQVSSRISQQIQSHLLDQLVLEFMSNSKDVTHLYSNGGVNVIKTMPFAILLTAAILGLFFPYFSIVAGYFICWALIFGFRYKHVSDLLSTLSRLQFVKEFMTAAIKERYSIAKTIESNEEEQYFRTVSVKYLVKHQSISGKEFLNLFSILSRDLDHKPFETTGLLKLGNLFSNKKDISDKENTDELFQKLIGQEEAIETLEYLIDVPNQDYSYNKEMDLVKSKIRESSGVSISEAVGLESKESGSFLKPYKPTGKSLSDTDRVESTSVENPLSSFERDISNHRTDNKNINDGLVTGAIAFIAGELTNHAESETVSFSELDKAHSDDRDAPMSDKDINNESIKFEDNNQIKNEKLEESSSISAEITSHESNEIDSEEFSLDDLDDLEDINNYELPESELSEEMPNYNDEISDDILEEIEKWEEKN